MADMKGYAERLYPFSTGNMMEDISMCGPVPDVVVLEGKNQGLLYIPEDGQQGGTQGMANSSGIRLFCLLCPSHPKAGR